MFVGREENIDSLEALWRKATSSMVVVSGRRRIGKSTLVETFAERSKCRFIEIEGSVVVKEVCQRDPVAVYTCLFSVAFPIRCVIDCQRFAGRRQGEKVSC